MSLNLFLLALWGAASQLIVHSDSRVQYFSCMYLTRLQGYQIRISMTDNGDPLENAATERIKGVTKEEYVNYYNMSATKQT